MSQLSALRQAPSLYLTRRAGYSISVSVLTMLLVGCIGAPVPQSTSSESLPAGIGSSPAVSDNAEAVIEAQEELAQEYNRRFVDCLNASGWPSQLHEDGFGYDVGGVQGPNDAAFSEAEAACAQEVGEPPEPPPLTDDVIRVGFQRLLALRECLEDAGYPVSDPPSAEFYIENFESNPWHPYMDIPDSQLDEATTKCPQ